MTNPTPLSPPSAPAQPPAPTPTPTQQSPKAPFNKKALTRSGEALELGGRALVGAGLIKGLIEPGFRGAAVELTPLALSLAILGIVLVAFGIYLQAEAER